MSKVTSKLQVTIPKAVAEAHGIKPGTEIQFESAGDAIRVTTVREEGVKYDAAKLDLDFRLRLFDEATERQKARETAQLERVGANTGRGWTREDLYQRGNGRST
jgi:AbrB family looped-hinge helix DNA binding protein